MAVAKCFIKQFWKFQIGSWNYYCSNSTFSTFTGYLL